MKIIPATGTLHLSAELETGSLRGPPWTPALSN